MVITIQAIQGPKVLFNFEVPLESKTDVQTLLEEAYYRNQTDTKPDPFTYTLEYYGYSQNSKYPTFLGYAIESINGIPATKDGDDGYYWELLVNDIVSQTGIDTTFPSPNATVTLFYKKYAIEHETCENSHQKTIHEHRLARCKA